jgi:hydroxymethylpyrimidine pyrophosphatase-like HAD family hydrolase
MTFEALAADYDGTLAHDGVVDEQTITALHRARGSGLRLIMVTGRELNDLFKIFSHSSLFDRIVAENGAVLYDPGTDEVDVLAPPPPPALLEALAAANVPVWVGRSIVATVEPYDQQMFAAIRDLHLEWHVIFNKGSVMALPAEITKATGLASALRSLGASADRTIAVGDAENDQAFMRSCGVAVAVANALPAVKDVAQIVTAGAQGNGVIELIDALLRGDLNRLLTRSNRSDSAAQEF